MCLSKASAVECSDSGIGIKRDREEVVLPLGYTGLDHSLADFFAQLFAPLLELGGLCLDARYLIDRFRRG